MNLCHILWLNHNKVSSHITMYDDYDDDDDDDDDVARE